MIEDLRFLEKTLRHTDPIASLPGEIQSPVDEILGLFEATLVQPKRRLQAEHLGVSPRIVGPARLQALLREQEGVVRRLQLAEHPPSVAEIGEGASAQFENPVGMVGVAEVPRQAHSQVGRLHGSGGI